MNQKPHAMTIALAGRRTDAPDADPVRFPLDRSDDVRERLQALFADHGATALVCSAACGADLLALEAAGALGMRRRVVLPFAPARFRSTSVTDRPGDWGPRFDRVIADVRASRDLVVLNGDDDPEGPYAAANRGILDEAARMANGPVAPNAPGVLGVVVWEGAPRGDSDMTAAFLAEARRRGFPVAEVRTL